MLYQELRSRRKHARVIGVGLSVALLLLAAFAFIIAKSLPSVTALRSAYFSSRLHKPVTVQQPGTVSATTQSATATRQAPAVAGTRPTAPAAPAAPRTLADYVTERFVERGEHTLTVCSLLPTFGTAPAPINLASLGSAITSQVQSSQPNPFAESMLAPLGAIMQIPNVATVVTQIRDAQDSGDTSVLRQTQFYSAVAFAASDVYSNRATIDRVSDHAYHLSVISKIAATIPGAGSDPALQDLCTAVEARALTPSTATLDDETAERASLLQLIGSMGLTPQQAGFDPNLSTRIAVQVTPTQLSLSSPWMTQLYGSGLQLSVQR